MYIRQIFVLKPLLAVGIMVCLGTILALFRLNRRGPKSRADNFLIGFLGLLTIYEGLRILRDAGIVGAGWNARLNESIELLVASSCLVAALILRNSRVNHLEVESAMRLARAAPPRSSRPSDSSLGLSVSLAEALNWGAPRLSDGAFKIFASLCMRADRVVSDVTALRLQTGKSAQDLDACLEELHAAGAVNVRRAGGNVEIELLTPCRRPMPPAEETPRPPVFATGSQI